MKSECFERVQLCVRTFGWRCVLVALAEVAKLEFPVPFIAHCLHAAAQDVGAEPPPDSPSKA